VAENNGIPRRFGRYFMDDGVDWTMNTSLLGHLGPEAVFQDFFNAICCMRGPRPKVPIKDLYYGQQSRCGRE